MWRLTDADTPIITSVVLGFPDWETYIDRTDMEFAKLGVAGHTILVASGDSGSESNYHCTGMSPEYPATSQFATCVGTSYANKKSFDTPGHPSLV